jgi:hypothetical protein
MSSRRFNPWAWLPFIVIGIAIIPNAALLLTARRTGVARSEGRPWEESRRYDEDKRAAAAFAAAGWRLDLHPRPGGVEAVLSGGSGAPPADLVLRLQRPDTAALDITQAWQDPARPLAIALARSGRWRVRLDGGGTRALVETALDLPR